MPTRLPSVPLLAGLLLAGLCAGGASAPAAAAEEKADAPKVRARAFLKTDKLPAGGKTEVAVVLDVHPDWHIKSNPAPKYAIPTTVTVKTARGTTVGEFAFPTLPPAKPGGPRRPVEKLAGRVVLRAPVAVPVAAAGADETLTVTVKYQACSDTSCLRPKTLTFGGMLPVAAPGESVHLANAEWFPKTPRVAGAPRSADR